MNKKFLKVVFLACTLCIYFSCNSDTSVKQAKVEKEHTPSDQTNDPKNLNKKIAQSKDAKAINSSTKLSSIVNPKNVDLNLLNQRLLYKINVERKRLNLLPFTHAKDLTEAAKIHNNYMIKKNVLDHTEKGSSTPNMMDRIKKAGGNYRTAGENIQFEGFMVRTTNGVQSIVAPTYEQLAENIWMNWKNSPPHYKNLINPDFRFLGTSIGWSDKKSAMFATQVYGGN